MLRGVRLGEPRTALVVKDETISRARLTASSKVKNSSNVDSSGAPVLAPAMWMSETPVGKIANPQVLGDFTV
jgi:hypothetical protein